MTYKERFEENGYMVYSRLMVPASPLRETSGQTRSKIGRLLKR